MTPGNLSARVRSALPFFAPALVLVAVLPSPEAHAQCPQLAQRNARLLDGAAERDLRLAELLETMIRTCAPEGEPTLCAEARATCARWAAEDSRLPHAHSEDHLRGQMATPFDGRAFEQAGALGEASSHATVSCESPGTWASAASDRRAAADRHRRVVAEYERFGRWAKGVEQECLARAKTQGGGEVVAVGAGAAGVTQVAVVRRDEEAAREAARVEAERVRLAREAEARAQAEMRAAAEARAQAEARAAAERQERERLESERQKAAREAELRAQAEAKATAQARAESERQERERLEAARREQQRLEAERLERAREAEARAQAEAKAAAQARVAAEERAEERSEALQREEAARDRELAKAAAAAAAAQAAREKEVKAADKQAQKEAKKRAREERRQRAEAQLAREIAEAKEAAAKRREDARKAEAERRAKFEQQARARAETQTAERRRDRATIARERAEEIERYETERAKLVKRGGEHSKLSALENAHKARLAQIEGRESGVSTQEKRDAAAAKQTLQAENERRKKSERTIAKAGEYRHPRERSNGAVNLGVDLSVLENAGLGVGLMARHAFWFEPPAEGISSGFELMANVRGIDVGAVFGSSDAGGSPARDGLLMDAGADARVWLSRFAIGAAVDGRLRSPGSSGGEWQRSLRAGPSLAYAAVDSHTARVVLTARALPLLGDSALAGNADLELGWRFLYAQIHAGITGAPEGGSTEVTSGATAGARLYW